MVKVTMCNVLTRLTKSKECVRFTPCVMCGRFSQCDISPCDASEVCPDNSIVSHCIKSINGQFTKFRIALIAYYTSSYQWLQ